MALADRIIGAESGGNATARNPRSSATGAGQFIDGTWLATIAKHRPDLAGLPRADVLALRNDPTLSREMTQAYADDNGAILRSAGFEATPGNTYLAHFAGPGGAKAVLGADPSVPVSAVLPASSIAANPFLRPMSAGDLVGWAARKVGGDAAMTMPAAAGGPAAPARFGFSGIEAAPAVATPSPKSDDGPDVASILKTLMAGGGGAVAQAAAAPAPAPALAAPPRPAAPAFDTSAYLATLRRR